MSPRRLVSKPRRRVFGRLDPRESRSVGEILRQETTGGFLLVGAALFAILWANSPFADAYFALRDLRIGYEPWGLDLTLGTWASDGLLAIFFFLVGLELKRELVAGELRTLSRAIVPVAAAVGGVLVPAVFYVAVNAADPAALRGWAIPTATDIAFAVAVLAIIGSNLPPALRLFLLTLAVVDDLIAIGIIAIVYTTDLSSMPLVAALVPVALYAFLVQGYPAFFERRRAAAWLILFPLGVIVWSLVHASGVHATIAGVVLGFTVPALRAVSDGRDGGDPPDNEESDPGGLAEIFEHRFRPLSAGIAVPIFAFFAAGVAIGGIDGVASALTDGVAVGIVIGLVVGKPIGILSTTLLITRITRAELDTSLHWVDIVGVALLAGIGFTVSLLVAGLSFDPGSLHHDHAKIAIPAASVVAALLAALVLITRNRAYRTDAARDQVGRAT